MSSRSVFGRGPAKLTTPLMLPATAGSTVIAGAAGMAEVCGPGCDLLQPSMVSAPSKMTFKRKPARPVKISYLPAAADARAAFASLSRIVHSPGSTLTTRHFGNGCQVGDYSISEFAGSRRSTHVSREMLLFLVRFF